MPLFAVKQVGFDGTLVVDAARAVAAEGWWVFQDPDGRPLVALPAAEVDAIESIPEADARGHVWRHAPDPATRRPAPAPREEHPEEQEHPAAPRRRWWSEGAASPNATRAAS